MASPIREPTEVNSYGIEVAGVRDIGAMKRVAITRRGLRRDFWDLYALIQSGTPLSVILDTYRMRLGVAESDLYHVLKALTFFEDAEREATLPAGMTLEFWEKIKRFFLDESPGRLFG
jgi:hypothetical protein